MFDRIAERYDLLNTITSMGLHHRWRQHAVSALPSGSRRILDLAAGTCDVTLAAVRRFPASCVVAVEPSVKMLQRGLRKVEAAQIIPGSMGSRIVPIVAEAEALPFSAGFFDGAVISFGIRNFQNRRIALAELKRVLRPGGRLVILELTRPSGGIMGNLAFWYTRRIIPLLGALLSGGAAYAYLPRSIEAFPRSLEFTDELQASGFSVRKVSAFVHGICHLFVCETAISEEGDGFATD